MKCLNCENESSGKSKYCSDRCKVAYNRNKTVTESPVTTVTEQTVTSDNVTVQNKLQILRLPDNFGLDNCTCKNCQQNRSQPAAKQLKINHGQYLKADKLQPGQINRVSLPGDIDYTGYYININTGIV